MHVSTIISVTSELLTLALEPCLGLSVVVAFPCFCLSKKLTLIVDSPFVSLLLILLLLFGLLLIIACILYLFGLALLPSRSGSSVEAVESHP